MLVSSVQRCNWSKIYCEDFLRPHLRLRIWSQVIHRVKSETFKLLLSHCENHFEEASTIIIEIEKLSSSVFIIISLSLFIRIYYLLFNLFIYLNFPFKRV